METSIWTSVLDSLKQQINKQSFDLWLKETEFRSLSNDRLTIKVVDDIAARHIRQNYLSAIEAIIQKLTNRYITCEFVIEKETPSSEPSVMPSDTIIQGTLAFNDSTKALLNPNYTFETFVVGPNNQFAHAAALSVAKSPANTINPLFFWGASGLGKTHLMMAIGNALVQTREYLKIHYVHTNEFIDEYIYSIRTNTAESFKIKYFNMDVLLIDDIQGLAGKIETQNNFFHIFNTLHQKHKQIVIASDRPPKELKTLDDRLRTRFEGGYLVDLQPPTIETREAILRNKAERENLILSDDVIYYIAKRIRTNIRTLEGAITSLKMVSIMFNEQITIQHAKQHLRDKFEDDDAFKVTVKDIMNKVSARCNVSIGDMKSKSRQNRVVLPRFMAMYICRQMTDLTTPEIGHEFGGRDHSTVLNAIKKIEEDMAENSEIQEQIEDIINELKS